MPVIDTHCHYNLEPLYSGQKFIFDLRENDPLLKMNWRDHWQIAQNKGVAGSIVIGTSVKTTELALKIAETEPNLLVAVGIHPSHAHEITIKTLDEIAKNWLKKKFHAVGETGLDFYRLDQTSDQFKQQANQQKIIFRWHIKLAKQANVPLILHVRDKGTQANWQTLEIIEQEYQGNKPFVLHCASGPADYIKKALALGAYIGFDGNITYPKANSLRELIKNVPTNRLLIETDAPFLPPQGYRGRVCEPWMIAETTQYAKRELGLDFNQIFENTQHFFNHTFVK